MAASAAASSAFMDFGEVAAAMAFSREEGEPKTIEVSIDSRSSRLRASSAGSAIRIAVPSGEATSVAFEGAEGTAGVEAAGAVGAGAA
jgi:uncharacterized protein YcgI (DUF1989 family)